MEPLKAKHIPAAEPKPIIPPAGGVAIGAITLGLVLSLVIYLFASHGQL